MDKTNKKTSNFCEVKDIMALWDDYVLKENIRDSIEKALNYKQILMTFLYPEKSSTGSSEKIYGATEDGRLSFARMKEPNKKDIDVSDSFQAYDLEVLLKTLDKPDEMHGVKIFDKKDIKKIKIISVDQAADKLSSLMSGEEVEQATKEKPKNNKIVLKDKSNERKTT